jgi:hypothetical protein
MSQLVKSRLYAIAAGTLIALAGFALVLWGVAWLLPKFLRYTDSPWPRGLSVFTVLFASACILIGNLLRRGVKISRLNR